jgi:dsDNA-specific endonuclease/ATPase MutS2
VRRSLSRPARALRDSGKSWTAASARSSAAFLTRYKSCLADGYATLRGGRHVLPVLRKFQGQFPGSVVDASASGGTVFMEPDAIRLTQNELDGIQGEIDAEERRMLYTLSAAVADAEDDLRRAMKLMTELDMLFARAKLSARMKGVPAELTSQRQIRLTGARHRCWIPGSACPSTFTWMRRTQASSSPGRTRAARRWRSRPWG